VTNPEEEVNAFKNLKTEERDSNYVSIAPLKDAVDQDKDII
jgi:hypothetical protein